MPESHFIFELSAKKKKKNPEVSRFRCTSLDLKESWVERITAAMSEGGEIVSSNTVAPIKEEVIPLPTLTTPKKTTTTKSSSIFKKIESLIDQLSPCDQHQEEIIKQLQTTLSDLSANLKREKKHHQNQQQQLSENYEDDLEKTSQQQQQQPQQIIPSKRNNEASNNQNANTNNDINDALHANTTQPPRSSSSTPTHPKSLNISKKTKVVETPQHEDNFAPQNLNSSKKQKQKPISKGQQAFVGVSDQTSKDLEVKYPIDKVLHYTIYHTPPYKKKKKTILTSFFLKYFLFLISHKHQYLLLLFFFFIIHNFSHNLFFKTS